MSVLLAMHQSTCIANCRLGTVVKLKVYKASLSFENDNKSVSIKRVTTSQLSGALPSWWGSAVSKKHGPAFGLATACMPLQQISSCGFCMHSGTFRQILELSLPV